MKSISAVTILGTFAVIALVYSVACDEMGLEMTDSGIVEMQEELSTCVCRVDGDIENPGDGKSWETACPTVDECVDRIEASADVNEGCEVWVRQGTVVDGIPMDSSKLKAEYMPKNIKAYGGFKGTEKRRQERIVNALQKIAQSNQIPPGENTTKEVTVPSRLLEPDLIDIPEPNLLDLACASCSNGHLIVGG